MLIQIYKRLKLIFLSNIIDVCTSKCENKIDSASIISIDRCNFSNNIAKMNGRCIKAIGSLNTSIMNWLFFRNKDKQNGGAIYAETHAIKIELSQFVSCAAGVD